MSELVDSKILEEFLSVDSKAIILFTREGMPREKNGKYDFLKCVKWQIDNLRMRLNEKKYLTRKEVAHLLGYRVEYINQLEKDDALPKESFNRYDIEKVIKWFIGYYKNLCKKEIDKITAADPQKELTGINKDLKQLIYRQKIGELVVAADVKLEWVNEVKRISQALDALPFKILPKLKNAKDDIEISSVLRNEINEMRNRLSELPSTKRAEQRKKNFQKEKSKA